jgi:hypothetical protein
VNEAEQRTIRNAMPSKNASVSGEAGASPGEIRAGSDRPELERELERLSEIPRSSWDRMLTEIAREFLSRRSP